MRYDHLSFEESHIGEEDVASAVTLMLPKNVIITKHVGYVLECRVRF